ncbi:hypothetical protein Tco_1549561 [Tanacetum coccineum]
MQDDQGENPQGSLERQFRDEEDDIVKNLKDLEECGEDKANIIMGTIHDKLNDDCFNGTTLGDFLEYWGFLRVGTTLDIFQNIILIPYLEYGVLSPLDTAY